jgi:hypothetical protein
MDMSEYKPDGKCGTCRHAHMTSGGGFHEPPYSELECGVEDELIQIGRIRQDVDDAYGPDGIEGCGDTRPCPLYLQLRNCEKHGKLETGEFGCPDCDEEAAEAQAKDHEEDEQLAAEWRKENGLA